MLQVPYGKLKTVFPRGYRGDGQVRWRKWVQAAHRGQRSRRGSGKEPVRQGVWQSLAKDPKSGTKPAWVGSFLYCFRLQNGPVTVLDPPPGAAVSSSAFC